MLGSTCWEQHAFILLGDRRRYTSSTLAVEAGPAAYVRGRANAGNASNIDGRPRRLATHFMGADDPWTSWVEHKIG